MNEFKELNTENNKKHKEYTGEDELNRVIEYILSMGAVCSLLAAILLSVILKLI